MSALTNAPFSAQTARLRTARALLAAALVLAGCGDFSDRTKAQVRLVHAADSSGYPALDMRVDGSLRQGGVTYGQTASYEEVDPDRSETTISNAGSPTALLTFTPSLAKNKNYTVLAFGATGALRQTLLDENLAQASNNRTSLRVINAAADAGSLDVYITTETDRLDTAVAARAAATYGELSPVIDVGSGTWRVRVAAAGSKTDVRLDVSGVSFGSREVLTLVLTPSRGGALVNALLLVQDGAVTRVDSTQARLRVLAGVASSGTVTASAGGTTLLSGIASPVVGDYTLVTAGTPAINISVNGNSVGAPAGALAAGGDYTLLVYGALATPSAALVEDNNRLPTVSGKVNVRLVNAATALAGPLSMTVDARPVAGNVAVGTASTPYVSADANETASIVVTAAGGTSALLTISPQRLIAASVYTVFVVGTAPTPVGVVSRDRN